MFILKPISCITKLFWLDNFQVRLWTSYFQYAMTVRTGIEPTIYYNHSRRSIISMKRSMYYRKLTRLTGAPQFIISMKRSMYYRKLTRLTGAPRFIISMKRSMYYRKLTRLTGAPRFIPGCWWGSRCAMFSFLCSVCPFALSVPIWLTASDYPFGILKLFLLY